MRILFPKFVAAVMLTLGASVSLAHTSATSSPKSGSILTDSPAVIEIKFEHEANLTSVVVVAMDKTQRKLEFTPKGSAKVFTVSKPNLTIGRNEVQWKALSKDGHVVNGTLVFDVKPLARTN